MTAVTILTAGAASAETLSDAEYRDIYDELRAKCSLRQFAEFIGSEKSFAWWSKYERGEAALSRAARNELRRAVGLPALPTTVAEAVAAADPDATVYVIGPAPADRLVLLSAAEHEPLTLRVNGACEIVAADHPTESHVTPVTSTERGAVRGSIHLDRVAWQRLNQARLRAGLTWAQFLAPLEAA